MIQHALIVPPVSQMLANLDAWLTLGVEHAERVKFDPELLLGHRLAPDQFTLRRQVQAACDQAKFIGVRLTGKEAAAHDDGDQTLAELRARIADVKSYLAGLSAADFEGAEAKLIPQAWAQGKVLTGAHYLSEFAIPNFYFHASMAYAILRSCGVPLGKYAYIGHVSLRDA